MAAITQRWTFDLDRLQASGAVVTAGCSRCGHSWIEDLDMVRRFRGGGYSFLGRRGRCPRPGCGNDQVAYLAAIPGVTNALNLSLFPPRLWIVEIAFGTPSRPTLHQRTFEAHQGDRAWRWGALRRAHPEAWHARIRDPDAAWRPFRELDEREPWPEPKRWARMRIEQDR